MKITNITLVVLLTALFLGCQTTGFPIQDEMVKSIIPRKTTKRDMLDMFRAPEAIASPNEIITLSSTAIMENPFSNNVVYRLSADTFFALFPSADKDHRVYYFCYTVRYTYPFWYVLYIGENGKSKADQLWVLVNEKTGLVEDYAFKRYKEDTIFSRSP